MIEGYVNAKEQQGSALITALFIMVLVTIAAVAMTLKLQLDIYRTRLNLTTNKQYFAAQFVTFWAMNELSNKKNTFSTSQSNGMVSQFPPSLSKQYPPFYITGGLYDLQSRFNVNNLTRPNLFLSMFHVLEDSKIKLDLQEERRLVMEIYYWLSPYRPGNDKDNLMPYYLQQDPPYLPAHQLLYNISELRLLNGVTAFIYNKVSPKLTALPEQTPLNINTMPPELLHILGSGLSKEQVERILKIRGKKGIHNPGKLTQLINELHIPQEQVTIASQYFVCITNVNYDNSALTYYTILKRTRSKDGKISVSLISESLNTA